MKQLLLALLLIPLVACGDGARTPLRNAEAQTDVDMKGFKFLHLNSLGIDLTSNSDFNNEVTARINGDTAEAATRASADTAEATARANGDATLTARTISTTPPLAGGGNLSADRTLSIPRADSVSVDGYISHDDFYFFQSKLSPGALTLNVPSFLNKATVLGVGTQTITLTLATQAAHAVFMGPTTSTAAPTFRVPALSEFTNDLGSMSTQDNSSVSILGGNIWGLTKLGIGVSSPTFPFDVRTSTDHNFAVLNSIGNEVQIEAINNANSAYQPMHFSASAFSFENGTVAIGTGGTPISSVLSVVGNIFVGADWIHQASTVVGTVTVPGAAIGDTVLMFPTSTGTAVISGTVTSADTVTVYALNVSTSDITACSCTFAPRATVIKF